MVQLIVVSSAKDGFAVKILNVKTLDMKEIAREFPRQISSWGFNADNCEIFYNRKGLVTWVARRTGRGWTRIATYVKNWDKYASPSWVKKVKDLGM